MFFTKNKKLIKAMVKSELISKIPLIFIPSTPLPVKSCFDEELEVKKTSDIFNIFWKHWNHKTIDFQEQYMVLYMNSNLVVMGIGLETIGDKDSCSVDYNNIINRTKIIGAKRIATAHNHPSGRVKPSKIDIKSEMAIKKLAKEHGIIHEEHIILSPKKRKYFSFKDAFIF